MRPLPMYDVGPSYLMRGAVAGTAAAVGVGLVLAFVPGGLFFLIWESLIAGALIGEAISRATNRKRGRELMVVAVLCLVLAFVLGAAMRPILLATLFGARVGAIDIALVRSVFGLLLDPVALIILAIGSYFAAGRFR